MGRIVTGYGLAAAERDEYQLDPYRPIGDHRRWD